MLSEIQRLKEEANRFIAILNAAENEDTIELPQWMKQNLKAEVESLKVRKQILSDTFGQCCANYMTAWEDLVVIWLSSSFVLYYETWF